MSILASGTTITGENRDAWLASRANFIGGSEAWRVLTNPLALYLEKTGVIPPQRSNLAMEFGLFAEPFIVTQYERETGRKIAEQQTLVVDPKRPYARCTLDWRTECGRHGDSKLVGPYGEAYGDPGTDDVPERVMWQAIHNMLCCQVEEFDIAALFTTTRFAVYPIRLNWTLAEILISAEERFAWHLEHRVKPIPGESELGEGYSYAGALGLKQLSGPIVEWVERYEMLGPYISAFEKERDALKPQIHEALGDVNEGILPDGRRVKRYHTEPCHVAYTKPATDYFRILKGKTK